MFAMWLCDGLNCGDGFFGTFCDVFRWLGFWDFGFGGFDEFGDEAFELIWFFVGTDLLLGGEGA
jgi:hypothetical protein